MGYKRQKKQFRLRFASDTGYDGFECLVRSLSIDAFLELTGMAGDKTDGQAVAGQTRAMLKMLVANVVSWNLEDEDGIGVPVALAQCVKSRTEVDERWRCGQHQDEENRCEVVGLMAEDVAFGMDIIMAWMEGMSNVSVPLDKNSPSGKPSLVASIPMDVR